MKVLELFRTCVSVESERVSSIVPSFHVEYDKRFKGEREHVGKLEHIYLTFDIYTKEYGTNEMIEDDIEQRLACKSNWFPMMVSRWGKNILFDERLQDFVDFEPLHSIFEQYTCCMSMCRDKFYSMKNYTIPEWEYKFGRTHVSIGCVDFEQLLLAAVSDSIL